MRSERSTYIRASEIGTFVFCARAWWLQRVEGLEPGNVEQRLAGEAAHVAHGRRVWAAVWLRRAALAVLALAVALLAWRWLAG